MQFRLLACDASATVALLLTRQARHDLDEQQGRVAEDEEETELACTEGRERDHLVKDEHKRQEERPQREERQHGVQQHVHELDCQCRLAWHGVAAAQDTPKVDSVVHEAEEGTVQPPARRRKQSGCSGGCRLRLRVQVLALPVLRLRSRTGAAA